MDPLRSLRSAVTPECLLFTTAICLVILGATNPPVRSGDAYTNTAKRYVVIDLGTSFYPAGLNNSNIVVGNTPAGPAIWDWTSNTSHALAINSVYTSPATDYSTVGLDDAGHIVGRIICEGEGFPVDEGTVGCYWTNATSTPSLLGQGQSTTSGVLTLQHSWITAISGQGYTVGYGTVNPFNEPNTLAFAYNRSWVDGGTNVVHVLASPNNANVYAQGAGGSANWCGWWLSTNAATQNYAYPEINGTAYTSSAYSNMWLKPINDSGIAAGYNNDYNAVMASAASGSTLAMTNLGPGNAYYLNNQLDTNGAPIPQVIGYDTNSIPTLWDKIDFNGMPCTNAAYSTNGYYVSKPLSALISQPPNGLWTMTGVNGINNGGAIIGYANFTKIPLLPVQHAVLLVPNYITRDGLPVNATNNTVWVGQQINLTNFISGIPTNAVTSYHWIIPGASNTPNDTAFYDYEPNVNNSGYTNLFFPTNYTTNSYIQFYWSSGSSNQVVYCTNVIYGQTNVVSATFNVSRPNAKVTAMQGQIAADMNFYHAIENGYPYLHFGCDTTNPAPPGMTFSQTNTLSMGSNQWVQIIATNSDYFTNTTASSTNSGFASGGLDGFYPYPGDTTETDDSPGGPLHHTSVRNSRHFGATMYFMWRPATNIVNGDNTVWVPLRGFQWNWSATATNASPTTNDGAGWGLQSTNYPTNTTDVDVTNEPTWTMTNTWNYTP